MLMIFSVHWAKWLCVLPWNGSQKGGEVGSLPDLATLRSKAVIQIWGALASYSLITLFLSLRP